MTSEPETIEVRMQRVSCDGSGHGIPAALGHPKVWLEIDESGYADPRSLLYPGQLSPDRRQALARETLHAAMMANSICNSSPARASASTTAG
jgi:uncharacterized Zn-finger protein